MVVVVHVGIIISYYSFICPGLIFYSACKLIVYFILQAYLTMLKCVDNVKMVADDLTNLNCVEDFQIMTRLTAQAYLIVPRFVDNLANAS